MWLVSLLNFEHKTVCNILSMQLYKYHLYNLRTYIHQGIIWQLCIKRANAKHICIIFENKYYYVTERKHFLNFYEIIWNLTIRSQHVRTTRINKFLETQKTIIFLNEKN